MTALLLTGPPHSGKSTALRAALGVLSEAAVPVTGFHTTEVVNDDGSRVGFDVIDAADSTQVRPLARSSWTDAPAHVGRYGVRPAVLERFLRTPAPGQLTVVDEIGRMQLLHPQFASWVTRLLQSSSLVLGTIHIFDHPVTDQLRQLPGVEVFQVTPGTRDDLPGLLAARILGHAGAADVDTSSP